MNRDHPRERIVSDGEPGAACLSDAELIGLVLNGGGPAAVEAARGAIEGAGGLRNLGALPAPELEVLPGFGVATAARVAAAFELGRRCKMRDTGPRRFNVRHPDRIAAYLTARLADLNVETFGVVLLDARNRIVRQVDLARGGWSAAVVRPREVFRLALVAAAPALILYHNHPSGDPAPSREDINITRKLIDAGQLLGIKVLDHLIIAREGYASLRERGLM